MHHIELDIDRIPEAIKEVLEKEKVSESELAERCDVPQPTLNKIARGEAKPSLATLKKLWPFIGQRLLRTSH